MFGFVPPLLSVIKLRDFAGAAVKSVKSRYSVAPGGGSDATHVSSRTLASMCSMASSTGATFQAGFVVVNVAVLAVSLSLYMWSCKFLSSRLRCCFLDVFVIAGILFFLSVVFFVDVESVIVLVASLAAWAFCAWVVVAKLVIFLWSRFVVGNGRLWCFLFMKVGNEMLSAAHEVILCLRLLFFGEYALAYVLESVFVNEGEW